jgi:archaellum component FlaC
MSAPSTASGFGLGAFQANFHQLRNNYSELQRGVTQAIDGIRFQQTSMDAELRRTVASLNERLSSTEKVMHSLYQRMGSGELMINQLSGRMGDIQKGLRSIESLVETVKADIAGLRTQVNGNSASVDDLQSKISDSALPRGLKTNVDKLQANFSNLESALDSQKTRLDTALASLDDLKSTIPLVASAPSNAHQLPGPTPTFLQPTSLMQQTHHFHYDPVKYSHTYMNNTRNIFHTQFNGNNSSGSTSSNQAAESTLTWVEQSFTTNEKQ